MDRLPASALPAPPPSQRVESENTTTKTGLADGIPVMGGLLNGATSIRLFLRRGPSGTKLGEKRDLARFGRDAQAINPPSVDAAMNRQIIFLVTVSNRCCDTQKRIPISL